MFTCTATISNKHSHVLAEGTKQQCLLAAMMYMQSQNNAGRWEVLANEPNRNIWRNLVLGDEITVTDS